MGSGIPKQYLPLAGHTVIEHVLECFLAHPRIAGITVAISASDAYWKKYRPCSPAKPVCTALGGEERSHSVLNALHSLRDELHADDWVLVHDAVRPCLHAEDLDKLMQTLEQDQVGGILASPLADTVKDVSENHLVHDTPDRERLWRAFTPQMFRYGLLSRALESALASGCAPTDESAAIEAACPDRVHVVEGRSDNIKITRPSDLTVADAILASRKRSKK